jgi:hypothetical protein
VESFGNFMGGRTWIHVDKHKMEHMHKVEKDIHCREP